MRVFLSAILIISLSSSLADQPYELGSRHIQGTGPSETWDTIYLQDYSYENLLNGYSIYGAGDRWACDDFQISGSGVWVRSDVIFEQDSDMFFYFDGQFLALESETWGTIKNLF